jgi:hypothetical protein
MLRTILLLLVFATLTWAQVSSGSISGQAEDETGGRLASVNITARQVTTGFVRTTVSDQSGAYQIDNISPGIYAVSADRQGFQRLIATQVIVEINQDARLNLRMKVGEAHDSVTVTAAVSNLQSEDSTVGYRLDSQTFTQLPLDERNVISLVTLGPGAIPRHLGGFVHDVDNDVQAGARGSVALNPSINGSRPSMNSFLLDGAYNTDRNTFAIVVTPPMESVQEFRVQSSLASVAAFQSGGGGMDIVTKSGGRTFHGNGFEYFRNEASDARNYFDDPALQRPIFRRNQFGGSLGGPLGLPSTFFFVTYEGLREKTASPSLQLVPDAAQRRGDFQGGNQIFDPLTTDLTTGARVPFAGNLIPQGRIDSIAANYLARFEPLPNRTGGGSSNYMDATPSTNHHDSASGRIDHQFQHAGLLFGRYTFNDDRGGVGGSFPVRPTSERLLAQQAVVGYSLGSAMWTNEARFSFARLRLLDVPLNPGGHNIAAELGILAPPNDPSAFGLPYFFLSDFSTATDDPSLPQTQRDNTFNLSDTLSLVRGKHIFRFGFDWVGFQLNYRQSNNVRGQYGYNGGWTANQALPNTGEALADFLLGFPLTTQRTIGSGQGYLRQNIYAAFAQQEWRVNSRLTLSAGVRYEYASPFSDARHQLLNLDYSTLPGPPRLVNVDQATSPNRLNLAPQAGLAWRLPGFQRSHGDTVFRAGYGLYYAPEIAVESYDLVLNNTRNEINTTTGTGIPVLTTRNGFPVTSGTGLPNYFGLDHKAPTPYVQQWNAGFQHEFPGDVLFEAAYIGSKGTHIGRFDRLNTALHTETGENLSPRPGDLQLLRTFPELGTIIQRKHIANSSYNSLQLKAEKRFQRNLTFLISYVWSKSIDDADSVAPSLFDSSGAQDERNLRLERALSFFNVPRRLSGGAVYNLPGPKLLRGTFRAWQLSGVITLQDGTPLDPLYQFTNISNAGTIERPNVVPGQSISLPASQRTPDHWFNTAAFATPAPYTFGNAGRDIIPGTSNAIVDIALHKRFTIAERYTIEFRAESFNALNHPNLGIAGPWVDLGPYFGKIFTAGQPRRFQFAVRFEF